MSTIYEIWQVICQNRRWFSSRHLHWTPGWPHSNFMTIVGIRKLQSLDYHIALLAWSYVQPFLCNIACNWEMDGQTHRWMYTHKYCMIRARMTQITLNLTQLWLISRVVMHINNNNNNKQLCTALYFVIWYHIHKAAFKNTAAFSSISHCYSFFLSSFDVQFSALLIWYDKRCYFNMHSKADISELDLLQETKN